VNFALVENIKRVLKAKTILGCDVSKEYNVNLFFFQAVLWKFFEPPYARFDCEHWDQPRTQALSTTRLAGGKTLVQAGHVSPRFWEITIGTYWG
jgi:hypothetical protein